MRFYDRPEGKIGIGLRARWLRWWGLRGFEQEGLRREWWEVKGILVCLREYREFLGSWEEFGKGNIDLLVGLLLDFKWRNQWFQLLLDKLQSFPMWLIEEYSILPFSLINLLNKSIWGTKYKLKLKT